MTGLFSNAKKFARDVASDSIFFPKAAASWPSFRQSLADFARGMKNELFFFRKTVLNGPTADIVGKFSRLSQMEDTAEKADELLAIRQSAREKLGGGEAEEARRSYAAIAFLVFGGVLALATGPGALAGTLFLTAVTASGKLQVNNIALGLRAQKISDKIDREILGMAQGEGRAALFSSPKFQQRLLGKGLLKKAFLGANRGHTDDSDYDKMVSKLPKTPAPPPAAAA